MKKVLVLALAAMAVVACTDTTSPASQAASAKPGTHRPSGAETDPILFYQNDFSAAIAPDLNVAWSRTDRSLTPHGDHFLGEFLNDTIGLLMFMPNHSQLVVTVDLYIIRSWDGTDTQWGPDRFFIGAIDGPTQLSLLNTTFSNVNSNQNYPNAVGGLEVSAQSNSIDRNSLGYEYFTGAEHTAIDATYRLTYTFPHASNVAYIYFGAAGLQYLADESWGIHNISVSYIP